MMSGSACSLSILPGRRCYASSRFSSLSMWVSRPTAREDRPGTPCYFLEVSQCRRSYTFHSNSCRAITGMTFSRIGLWAFDLCQLKELQLALATHPRRNSLCVHTSGDIQGISLNHQNRTALQYSLQNVADMLKVQFLLTSQVRQ